MWLVRAVAQSNLVCCVCFLYMYFRIYAHTPGHCSAHINNTRRGWFSIYIITVYICIYKRACGDDDYIFKNDFTVYARFDPKLIAFVFFCVWFYSPSSFGDDHLGAQVVELFPQVFRFEVTLDGLQLVAIAGPLELGSCLQKGKQCVILYIHIIFYSIKEILIKQFK